ncbi:hypothetical protein [Deinococcus saxicola]|uniref:hypothetical protein n=1 Tax=Deinococcus saxicola TaxID=249406 RepID=UPI0039F08D0B
MGHGNGLAPAGSRAAGRRLAYVPVGHETDLWYTRPGTALMQLLRVSVQFPEWGEWLGHQG